MKIDGLGILPPHLQFLSLCREVVGMNKSGLGGIYLNCKMFTGARGDGVMHYTEHMVNKGRWHGEKDTGFT